MTLRPTALWSRRARTRGKDVIRMTAAPVQMGFGAPATSEDVAELEALGAHSLWVGGHVASPNPSQEPVVRLARLVEQTRTARVGTATLILPLYPPGLLAKQLAYLYSPERYAASAAEIRAEADRAGRDMADFGWYAYVFVSLDDDAARARGEAERFLGGTYRDDFSAMLDRIACVGTPEQVTDRLDGFVDAGARHLILLPCARAQETSRQLLAEILPRLARAR